jgi:hypothetical protein
LLNETADGLRPIGKVRLLAPPIVDLSYEFVVNPHLEGSILSPAGRSSNFFWHFCNFGIDVSHEAVYTKITNNARDGARQMAQAPRKTFTPQQMTKYREEYSTEELLRLALDMLDAAAERQRGKNAFLHNNTALEIIRDRVA